MPTSDKQLAANRANAAKSTGPRTPEGKTRSSQNARTHGFTASTFAVVRLEELDEVARLKHDLLAVYQPVNSQELFAIELIALAQQTRFRAARLESGVFINCLDMALNDNGTPFSPMTPALVGDGDIEITRAQIATTPWPMVSAAWPSRTTPFRCFYAIKPRPSSSTAAQWKN